MGGTRVGPQANRECLERMGGLLNYYERAA
jgi:hypothetical protein